ncbi:MAG: prepilin-type N-terminal cleavage/methylation domain-containing protein [Candidatus Levybacteria bacterium]|nr:prepilin-type N-terminal cleavage/methylation domain-containing protein [Candidatus Levybacteria bacterium]
MEKNPPKVLDKRSKGFSLIELLVVLIILGILAAALLATINPVEQLNKAQDMSLKNVAAQFVSANVRYYSVKNALPWNATANGGANCYTGGTTLASVPLSSLTGCVTTLITDGELKQSFVNSNNLSNAVVTNPNPQTGNAADTIVCFQPKSESQQTESNTRYTQSGSAGASCKSQGGTNDCYWCAQ